MKKVIILIICILILSACSIKKEKENYQEKTEEFILEKIDSNKDYVYLNNYKSIIYNNENYDLKTLTINVKSEDVENVNLALKSFVIKSYKDMNIIDKTLKSGNIIDYDYYITDKYITIIQKYYPYIDGSVGEEEDNVYVISLENGKSINNRELLEEYDYDENELYELIEKKSLSEDFAFTKMNIKNNGYKLYVDADSKLCIIFNEIDDNESIRKELVLN